jgi:hypothetical protein
MQRTPEEERNKTNREQRERARERAREREREREREELHEAIDKGRFGCDKWYFTGYVC